MTESEDSSVVLMAGVLEGSLGRDLPLLVETKDGTAMGELHTHTHTHTHTRTHTHTCTHTHKHTFSTHTHTHTHAQLAVTTRQSLKQSHSPPPWIPFQSV